MRPAAAGLERSAAHPANEVGPSEEPPHFAASQRWPKACTSVDCQITYVNEPIVKDRSNIDILRTFSTLIAGAIVTRMGQDCLSQAWSSAAR